MTLSTIRQSIAPTLIILRMAAGKAVKKNWSDIPLNDVVRNDVSRHTTASAHSLDSGMVRGCITHTTQVRANVHAVEGWLYEGLE